jgi:uncharacterized protein YbjQ (UPF0145 family)
MSQPPPFTGELSAAGLGLCRRLDLAPVAQVFGACAYRIGGSGAPVLGEPGYRAYFARGPRSPEIRTFELRRVSGAYDEARRRALTRLRHRASAAGADAVVGVTIKLAETGGDGATDCVLEYLATGTAMAWRSGSRPRRHATEPLLTPLSIEEWWRLDQAGYVPSGLVAATTVLLTRPSQPTGLALARGARRSGPAPQELGDLSAAVTQAQSVCHRRLIEQGRRSGGGGLIGVSLELRHGFGAGTHAEGARAAASGYGNLHLTVHGIGSVIERDRAGGGERQPARSDSMIWLS